jgi:hypothetical protein
MEKLLPIEEVIEKASKRGVQFGKGDPYNRLRYYTKMAWLPHMTRKRLDGKLQGHYPQSAVDTLVLIENMKLEGLSNDEIAKRLASVSEKRKDFFINELLRFVSKKNHIKAGIAILLSLGFLVSLGIIPVGKSKAEFIQKALESQRFYVIDSGTSFVPRGQREVFVKSKNIKSESRINVTFNSDYSPATRFWVSQKIPFEGYYLTLDAPIASDTEFSWWISN